MASRPVHQAPEPIHIGSRSESAREAAQRDGSRRLRIWLFLIIESILAVSLLVTQAPTLQGAVLAFGLLLFLDIVADSLPIRIYGDSRISVSFVVVTTIMVLYGVPGVAMAGALEGAVSAIVSKKRDLWAPHNAAMFVIVYSAGAATYGLIAETNPQEFAIEMVPAVLIATVVSFSLNALFIGAFGQLYINEPLSEFWNKHNWLVAHHLAFGATGLAMAMAFVALGVVGILAFAVPVFMFRVAMSQYVEKTKDNVQRLRDQNEQLRAANIEIRRVSDELRTSYDGTLEALVNALDARDQETKGHSLRVQHYMLDIAREMGVVEDTKDWVDMQRGSLLHDVGKIGVSDTILLKPGKLTEDEWESMRKHPEIGYHMLSQVKFLEGAAEIILAHHERWDGKGYPRRLHEDEIPLGARIFSVVDTFDSMTSDRPYRKALSTQESLNEILRCSNTQFDPRVVEAFLDIYDMWVQEREELHSVPIADLRRAA
jgi:putative nucleotidyltransferase with HDIG domain